SRQVESPLFRRRRVQHAVLEVLEILERLLVELRRKSDQVLLGRPLQIERRRLRRERLRLRRPLTRDGGLRDGTFFNRPHRLAGLPIEYIGERLLAHLDERLDLPAVYRDVAEHRLRGQIVVPETMVNRLEVPDTSAGLRLDCD